MTTHTATADDPTVLAPWTGLPGIGRTITVAALVGVLLATVAVVGAMVVFGYGWGAALGVGLMTGFWGGLGFGSMVGGVIHMSRHE